MKAEWTELMQKNKDIQMLSKDVQVIKTAILKSLQLQKDLPRLRGLSTSTIKRMRTFYEGWKVLIRPLLVDELKDNNETIYLSS